MARGGGNISYVPQRDREYNPSPLAALAMSAPDIIAAYQQAQLRRQQQAMMQAQLTTAQAQGQVANLEAGQLHAQQQANAEAARALLTQGQQEMSGFRLPFPNLPGQMQPQAPQPTDGGLAPRVTPQIRQQGSQPTLSPEVAQFFSDPATRAVAGMLASGRTVPNQQARLSLLGEKAIEIKQRQDQRRALSSFRAELARDPNSKDLLPRVDAFATLLDQGGAFSYDEARTAAQMLGLPPTYAEQLATKGAELELKNLTDTRAAGVFASDVLRKHFPTTFGQMPEGSFMPGADDTLRTLTVLDTQYNQNLRLQNNAHSNALRLEAERAKNEFEQTFTEEMIGLVGALARPTEDANGRLIYPDAQQISSHVNGIAAQYGVSLTGANGQALVPAINRAVVTEAAVSSFEEAVRSGNYANAQSELRTVLGEIQGLTDTERRQIFGEVMARVPRSQSRPTGPNPVMPSDAATLIGGVAPPAPRVPGIPSNSTTFIDPMSSIFGIQ